MFFSHHSKDNPKTKIDVEILETDNQVADEFKGFPILLLVDQLHVYLRKEEAERIFFLLGSSLQEIDRKIIDKTL